jgi:hypothetical protein
MTNKRQIIPVVGLIATMAGTTYMVVQLHAQTRAAGDFSNAAVAEVHDGQGQTLLRGQFVLDQQDDDDDIERTAQLSAAGADADAHGKAEVEVAKSNAAKQEIEFSVSNLEPGARVTFLIDGQAVGEATVDRRGRAKIDIDVR